MKKLITLSILLLSFSIFAQDKTPYQILSCSNEGTFVDVRFIPKYEMIEVTVTTELQTSPQEKSYTKELSFDEMGLIENGSWVIDLKGAQNDHITMVVTDNRDGYIAGNGFPELMSCHKKASIR